jgi:hypothetical protein
MGPVFRHLLAGNAKAGLAEIGAIRALIEEDGDRHLTMYVVAQEGLLEYLAGRIPEARRAAQRHLDLSLQLSNPRALATVAELAAYLSIASGDPVLGARLLGAAEAGREATGAPHFPQWENPLREAAERALRALGKQSFEAGRAAGRKMGLREAVALAAQSHSAAIAAPKPKARRSQRS